METTQAIRSFAALAHGKRLAVFRLLVQAGTDGIAASDIARQLAIPPATLSFHLKDLAAADLVIARQAGRFIFYSANYAAMNRVIAFLTDNCCGGNPCDVAADKRSTRA